MKKTEDQPSPQYQPESRASSSESPTMPAQTAEVLPALSRIIAVNSVRLGAQPRRALDPKHVSDLAANIGTVGLLQPIVVKTAGDDTYVLVAGAHRLAAIEKLGWKQVPAVIKDGDDRLTEICTLVENLKRLNLRGTTGREAIARLTELMGGEPGAKPATRGRPKKNGAPRTNSQRAVATQMGVSATKVGRAQRLNAKATPEVKAALEAGKVTSSQADELVTLAPEDQAKVLPLVIGKTRDETRGIVTAAKNASPTVSAGGANNPAAPAPLVQHASPSGSPSPKASHRLETVAIDLRTAMQQLIGLLADSATAEAGFAAAVEALLTDLELLLIQARACHQARAIGTAA